jgi:hypothetical protein
MYGCLRTEHFYINGNLNLPAPTLASGGLAASSQPAEHVSMARQH